MFHASKSTGVPKKANRQFDFWTRSFLLTIALVAPILCQSDTRLIFQFYLCLAPV